MGLSGSNSPEQYSRWRLIAGDRVRPYGVRWPVSHWGAGVTEVPGRAGRRPGPGPGDRVAWLAMRVRSAAWLRHLLDEPTSLIEVRRVTVFVETWRVPHGGWSGRLGPLGHVLHERARFPRTGNGTVRIDLELRWPRPLRTVLAAILPMLVPVRRLPRPVSADLTAVDVRPNWLGAGENASVVVGVLPRDEDIRAHDVLLTPPEGSEPAADDSAPAGLYGTTLTATPSGAGPRTGIVLVDLEHAVPHNQYGPFGKFAPRAELTFLGGADGRDWEIIGPTGLLCAGRTDRPWLTEEQQRALARIGLLRCAAVPARHPLDEAALLTHLVLAGVAVHAPNLSAAGAAPLAGEVADLLRAPLPKPVEGELAWEVRAVSQRRAVMRRHAAEFALPRLTAAAFPAIAALPSVSALLVTKRLEYVLDAVAAIEAQRYPNLEIVLCLHGVALPAELRARLADCARPLEILTLPAAYGFGEAIGAATARSRGSLVTKFDDDDTYGPEHVWDLVLARHYSGATMVGKGAEFVYLQTLNTTVRRDAGRPETFTAAVAGGTMLISRGDLEQVGGWRPVPRSVDRGLIDRVRRAGGLIYRTHPLGYIYQRRSIGHTWDPGLEYFLRGGGMQWPGLPRHREFGTAATTEEHEPSSTDEQPADSSGHLRPARR